MNSKLVRLPFGFFVRKKQPLLTPSMIITLLAACEKQRQHVPFGPSDIKGSFVTLVNRGLIIRQEVNGNVKKELQWQVTKHAILTLKILGIDVEC